MTIREPLVLVLLYAAVMALVIYLLIGDDDEVSVPVVVLISVIQVAFGFALGRWWGFLIVALAIVIAIPLGPEQSGSGEVIPWAVMFMIYSPFLAGLVVLGTIVRKLADRVSAPTRS